MPTLSTGGISSSDTDFFAKKYSPKLYAEGVVNNPVNKLLVENGCINLEKSLQSEGGSVTLYNALRLSANGKTGDIDVYSNAALLDKSARSLNIFKNQQPITWPLRGSQTQQFASFDLGSDKEMILADWARSLVTASMLNQLGGNTATTINQYACSEFAFTGDTLLHITGNNSVSIPTYHYEANLGGVVTTDAGVNTGNTLSLKDFQLAAEIITSQQPSKPTWQTIKGKSYLGVAFVSQSGLNQMINDPITAQQGLQLSQVYNSSLAGGKTMDLTVFQMPGAPFLCAVLPDSWLPRGVTLSGNSETANTRRAIIVGANAIDMALGAGYSGGGSAIPAATVEVDTEHKRLNKQGFVNASLLWGCKKAQSTGPGNGNSTSYDLSTYVIAHYSAQ